MRVTHLLLLLPLLGAASAMALPASVVRDTELKAEPFADAKTVASLKTKQKLDLGERKGGWYKAKSSDGKSGWVRLTAVLVDSSQGKGDSGVGSARQILQTGRSGSSGVTAATGLRGLDSADVVNSKPNPQAVTKLDTYATSGDESRRFAADAKLSSQNIGYIAEKAPAAAPVYGE